MVSKGKGRETHLSLPKQIARLLVWVPGVWNKPGQDIHSRKSLATAADPILPERGEGFQPRPEWPYIFSLQVHCASLELGLWGSREDRYWFIFQSSFSGRREDCSCLRKDGQSYRFTLCKGWEAFSVTGVRGGSPLSWRAVSVWVLRSLTHFLRGCWRADRPNTNKQTTKKYTSCFIYQSPHSSQVEARQSKASI